MRADSFKNFIYKMKVFPLWVKQVLYFQMKKDMESILPSATLNTSAEDFLQIYRPELTFVGKKELETRECCHEETMYTFLKSVKEEKSIIDITLDCFFTLQEVSKLIIEAEKNEYIKTPDSKTIIAVALFLSGAIKTGEYLLKIGSLSVDQLDKAIRYQEKLESEGKKIPMAEVLTIMQFIKKDEMVSLLLMKEESKKRFIFNIDLNSGEISNDDTFALKKQVEKLTYENEYLKRKLNAILKME